MSLLTIIQEVAGVLSLPVPTSIVGNSQPSQVLWLNLAQREGRELARRHDWQALIVQQTWTTVAAQAQPSALPSAYDHLVPDVEVWDRTGNILLFGPTPSDVWSRLQSGITGGVTGWWRIIGGVLYVYPAPTAGRTFALEYVSKNWCQSSGGTGQSTWQADADTGVISENLIALGITWRWLKSKGMDYAEDMATYEREVEKAASRDRGMSVLVAGKSHGDGYPPQPFWNGTISG